MLKTPFTCKIFFNYRSAPYIRQQTNLEKIVIVVHYEEIICTVPPQIPPFAMDDLECSGEATVPFVEGFDILDKLNILIRDSLFLSSCQANTKYP